MSFKIGVVGYGNLGRALTLAQAQNSDIEIPYVFTRRDPSAIDADGITALPYSDILNYKEDIDCLILAGGSKSDLPQMAPYLAEHFNIVDSYDNHSEMSAHVTRVGNAASASMHTAVVGAGWDPGLLSLARLYFGAFMPYASVNTIWGRGVSQGHSQALREIPGVRRAVQYTVPRDNARAAALRGDAKEAKDLHRRVCYIVADEGERANIRESILSMPAYFDGYEVELVFISDEEFERDHNALSHRGEVIASGKTGIRGQNRELAELSLELDSNPEFTAYVLIAAARAAIALNKRAEWGAKTFFDIPPKYFISDGGRLL